MVCVSVCLFVGGCVCVCVCVRACMCLGGVVCVFVGVGVCLCVCIMCVCVWVGVFLLYFNLHAPLPLVILHAGLLTSYCTTCVLELISSRLIYCLLSDVSSKYLHYCYRY